MKRDEIREKRAKLFDGLVGKGINPTVSFEAVTTLSDQEVLWMLEEYFGGESQHNYGNPLKIRRVIKMYESGKTMTQITDATGYGQSTIGLWIQANGAERGLEETICPVCEKRFVRNIVTKRYCSPSCSQKANKQTYYVRRRGATVNQISCRDITPLGLYKRDSGICHICGLPCNPEDYVKRDGRFIAGDSYPSVDHVVPLSKGGRHSWENVRLAHRRCNSAKGARVDYGQEEMEESD